MKILHVVPSLDLTTGGPSESVPMTALSQLQVGADVGIAAFRIPEESLKAREAARAGVRMHRFSRLPHRIDPMSISLDMILHFETVARDYDVIITHCNWMFPIWWAAHVARKLGKPYYMMPRGSFAPERLKISRWKKCLVGWIDRHYARHSRAIWATSESEAEGARKYVPGAKTEVFPIGLDVAKYGKVRVRDEGGRRTLLFFSRISPIKGLDLLAEAWSRIQSNNQTIPNQTTWKLLIVGPDDRGYTEVIKKTFASRCPAGSFEFRGPVYGETKISLLASADAFILPTRNENWGIAVAEAMASGLPVICTKGAPWSCLDAENAGRWVDVSVEGIQKGIEDILSLADDERRAMGARGRRWTEANLDWAVIAKRMMDSLGHEQMS